MNMSIPVSSKLRSRTAHFVAALPATTSTVHAADTAGAAADTDGSASDIVVTAQRRNKAVSKVPTPITTHSQAQMDRQGIRKIHDISRLTPALNFTSTSGVNASNGTNISIRGIASEVGSATTAIYIDGIPIQIRNITYLGGNTYPRVFDLERVEVDLSVFFDNLTNSKDVLSRNHDGLGGSLYYVQSFRPRTIGLTAQYRYSKAVPHRL